MADAYDQLLAEYGRTANLDEAGSVLRWDQQVTMPPGGTPARSKQVATLSALSHELLVDGEIGDLLDRAEGEELGDEEAAVVREVRREYERADSVPTALVEEISETASNALDVWEKAKAEDDFDAFAPTLERLVELRREHAAAIDPDRDPYAVLFEEFEPYLGVETAERVLGRLREELVPLIEAVTESEASQPRPFDGAYPETDQEALSRDVLGALGYDWDRGRLDTAAHPFSMGNQFDARVTTRYDESDPLGALTATVHEFGHARYTLGLPEEAYGTPLGEARDLTVHESQSRFWENHVGRTRAFWERFAPAVNDRLGTDLDAGTLYAAANRIYPENAVRVEADELTYHMHIVLRFEIERDLIRGDLDVSAVPEVWNEKMAEYLGVRPDTDAEGCLQDIHWAHGNFGYFPTYSLGSVLAAQLDHHLREDIERVDRRVREGEYGALHDWLTERVHRHGKRYTTPDLVEAATGEALTADYFLDHARTKFGDLYDL
jgi:carboxypeptidase Taq